MTSILAGILSLTQHLNTVSQRPEAYRLKRCPCCGKAGLWSHGNYLRKSDRNSNAAESLNTIPILRFYCHHCERTCSVLPECIPPQRWYLWCIQQQVVSEILKGKSLRKISQTCQPARSTYRRWWQRLKEQLSLQRDALCATITWLREQMDFPAFWISCFSQLTLSAAMLICHQFGVLIP